MARCYAIANKRFIFDESVVAVEAIIVDVSILTDHEFPQQRWTFSIAAATNWIPVMFPADVL